MRQLFIAALLSLALPGLVAAQERANTILVLDGSGSMWGQIDGINKIVIAREVVAGLLADFPADQNLGLTVYGHRVRGECTDIETIVAPGLDNRDAISAAVNAINPRGMTPMTDAVIAAAESLRYTEQKATVILVSDGIETCAPDPCAAAAALEQAGIDFTAHVIGFDVTEAEALRQMQCLADQTGGLFLSASNAAELTSALQQVAVAEPEPEPESEPMIYQVTFRAYLGDESIEITESVIWDLSFEGAVFNADAQGAPLVIDLINGDYSATAYYLVGEVETATSYTVSDADLTVSVIFPAPATTTFVATIGENGSEVTDDLVWTITPDGAATGVTFTGNTVSTDLARGAFQAQVTRSIDGATATQTFVVVNQAQTVTLTLPPFQPSASLIAQSSAPLGATIPVGWDGPNEANDYITVSRPGEDGYINYTRTRDGNPVELQMPPATGTYELRYIQSDGTVTLATATIEVTPVSVTLTAPAEGVAGATIPVGFEGPDYPNDYIEVGRPGEEGYINYTRTRDGNPLDLLLPTETGEWEIRYILNQDRVVMASTPISVIDVSATLSAPASANAGATVQVTWQGPDYQNDYIEVGRPGEEGYVNYTRTRDGSPLDLLLPTETGDWEIRYIVNQDRSVLARQIVTVTDVGASISAPASANAGATVQVTWQGPDYQNDYIEVGRPGEEGYVNYTRTRDGSPLDLLLPTETGDWEIRYIVNQDRSVLARQIVTVTDVTASVSAPAEAPAGGEVQVTWTGPDYQNDYIEIGRRGEDGYANYTRTRDGSPLGLQLPAEPGEWEIRYIVNQDRSVLARQIITVTPVTAQLIAPPSVPLSGGTATVGWDGPGYAQDYVSISIPGDSGYVSYEYTRNGNPLNIRLPEAPGSYELRYILNEGSTVLATIPLEVTAD